MVPAARCLYPFPVLAALSEATWTIESLLEDSEDDDSDNGGDDAEESEVKEGEDSH